MIVAFAVNQHPDTGDEAESLRKESSAVDVVARRIHQQAVAEAAGALDKGVPFVDVVAGRIDEYTPAVQAGAEVETSGPVDVVSAEIVQYLRAPEATGQCGVGAALVGVVAAQIQDHAAGVRRDVLQGVVIVAACAQGDPPERRQVHRDVVADRQSTRPDLQSRLHHARSPGTHGARQQQPVGPDGLRGNVMEMAHEFSGDLLFVLLNAVLPFCRTEFVVRIFPEQ